MTLHGRARRARRARRPVGRRQDDDRAARASHPRRQSRAACSSTGTTSATSRSSRCATPSGMVMQDPHLFHETIAENLRYAKPDATDAELVAACQAARIHDLIASLPDGLRHRRRRARLPHVGRREAAARDRPHAAEGPRDRHPRRGDVAPRLRVGARDPARARRRARGPHRARDRAPALDDRRRRPHRRARRRPHRRGGPPRRAPRTRAASTPTCTARSSTAPSPPSRRRRRGRGVTARLARSATRAPGAPRCRPREPQTCRSRVARSLAARRASSRVGSCGGALGVRSLRRRRPTSDVAPARCPPATTLEPRTRVDDGDRGRAAVAAHTATTRCGCGSAATRSRARSARRSASRPRRPASCSPYVRLRGVERARSRRRSSTGPSTRPTRWPRSTPRSSSSSSARTTPDVARADAGRRLGPARVARRLRAAGRRDARRRSTGGTDAPVYWVGSPTAAATTSKDDGVARGQRRGRVRSIERRDPTSTYVDAYDAVRRRPTASTRPTLPGDRRRARCACAPATACTSRPTGGDLLGDARVRARSTTAATSTAQAVPGRAPSRCDEPEGLDRGARAAARRPGATGEPTPAPTTTTEPPTTPTTPSTPPRRPAPPTPMHRPPPRDRSARRRRHRRAGAARRRPGHAATAGCRGARR